MAYVKTSTSSITMTVTFVKGFLLQEGGELEYDNTLDISSLYGPYMFANLHPRR